MVHILPVGEAVAAVRQILIQWVILHNSSVRIVDIRSCVGAVVWITHVWRRLVSWYGAEFFFGAVYSWSARTESPRFGSDWRRGICVCALAAPVNLQFCGFPAGRTVTVPVRGLVELDPAARSVPSFRAYGRQWIAPLKTIMECTATH